MTWTAFVIVQTTLDYPQPIQVEEPSQSVVCRTDPELGGAEIGLSLTPGSCTIHSMIGVQSNTTIYSATTVTLQFATKELCEAAAATLRIQRGVHSVSCLQTGSDDT